MSQGQWLLVTLTAGVGGSYTFFSHLRWAPVIALGYAASISVHMWINASDF